MDEARLDGSVLGDLLIEALEEAVAHARGEPTGARVRRVERPRHRPGTKIPPFSPGDR
ncbi:hypothetical protein FHS01_002554 [Longimicrobium terrae]|uniref:Uncharacterized protein n=1 Tax=Longimicrobium terrae TaxID=1639882 RepID=A0A841GYT3_9BACT|nr:hypothetical protein [Longimicrobium terrae]MBB6070941.1 hypothetical protein [Longimicrobium terrae]